MKDSAISRLFLVLVFSVGAAASALAGDVSYSYDSNGRLLTAIDNSKYCSGGSGCSNGVSYTYDTLLR
jgi:hypothetical protein